MAAPGPGCALRSSRNVSPAPSRGQPLAPSRLSRQRCTSRSLSALPITDIELRLIAAAAITGLKSNPNAGKSTPAAMECRSGCR